jgi:general secretion pathway protein D
VLPAADAAKPAGDAVNQFVPAGPQGVAPSVGIVTVPPTAAPAAASAATTAPVVAAPVVPAPVKRGLVQIAAPAAIDVGQQFYVDIKAGDVQNLAGAALVLSYNAKLVDYVSAAEGPFLKKDGKPTLYSATANAAEGTLTIKLSRTPNSGGMSGAGTLASALFRAKGKGTASYYFQSVNFTSADGKPHEMLPFSTAVNVR